MNSKSLFKKNIVPLIIILAICLFVYFINFIYSFFNSTVKYEKIYFDIQSKCEEKVSIKKMIVDDFDGKFVYVFFTLEDTDKIGFAIYKKFFLNRYEGFTGVDIRRELINEVIYVDEDLGAMILVFGKNQNYEISSVQIDYMDDKRIFNIAEEEYFFITDRYFMDELKYNKYSQYFETYYFDNDGQDITDYVIKTDL